MNYYRRYVGDYLKDTSRLSMLEHGAYGLLLDHYYAEELPVPLDMVEVYTMVRAMTPADRKAVDKVLAKYFVRQEDGYHNARADHEIEVSRKARDNGAKGGRPLTEHETGTVTGLQTGRVTGKGGGSGHPPTTNHQPSTSNPKPRAKAAGRGSRLPADWKPDAGQIEFCKVERGDLDPTAVGARFRDYWIAQPGARGLKLDWSATWRNWVRNEKRVAGAQPGKQARLEEGNAAAARAFAEAQE